MIDNYNIYAVLLLAFVTGISVGSFVTMASYRLPLGEEIVFKPSYCPRCNASLRAIDLIPLFSWILQRGKCRYCHSAISLRYPLSELGLGLTFAVLVYNFGPTITTLLLALLATELAILIVTDLEHLIIPDSIQIALFVTGILYSVHSGTPLLGMCINVVAGLAIGLTLHYGYFYIRKKDGLGWADVKFLAVAGVWIPLLAFVPFLFFAGLFGTTYGLIWQRMGRGEAFPFGPALACSLFINVLIPDIIQRILL